mmetsp:Transcript_52137/g.122189  ORF Transcript_52137/g.122189 Transcript_52137/m.122189 type:complete len:152 (-) Transcript_52137:376-831(-)
MISRSRKHVPENRRGLGDIALILGWLSSVAHLAIPLRTANHTPTLKTTSTAYRVFFGLLLTLTGVWRNFALVSILGLAVYVLKTLYGLESLMKGTVLSTVGLFPLSIVMAGAMPLQIVLTMMLVTWYRQGYAAIPSMAELKAAFGKLLGGN